MFPEEITKILLNNQTSNERLLNEINLSISTIKCALQDINEIISKDGDSSAVEESKILQEYIEYIQFVGEWEFSLNNNDIC